MTRKKVLLSVVSFAVCFALLLILQTVNHGRGWAFIEIHPWQTIVLPLVLIFLVLLARGLYKQYRLEPEEQTARK